MNNQIKGHGYDSPAWQAALVYEKEPCARTFRQDLELHLLNGYVVSTPEYFIMGRPIHKDSPQECIVDPSFPFNKADWDCWHVYLMAGDFSKVFDFYPFPLEWVSWERKNVLRFFKTETVAKRINS